MQIYRALSNPIWHPLPLAIFLVEITLSLTPAKPLPKLPPPPEQFNFLDTTGDYRAEIRRQLQLQVPMLLNDDSLAAPAALLYSLTGAARADPTPKPVGFRSFDHLHSASGPCPRNFLSGPVLRSCCPAPAAPAPTNNLAEI